MHHTLVLVQPGGQFQAASLRDKPQPDDQNLDPDSHCTPPVVFGFGKNGKGQCGALGHADQTVITSTVWEPVIATVSHKQHVKEVTHWTKSA